MKEQVLRPNTLLLSLSAMRSQVYSFFSKIQAILAILRLFTQSFPKFYLGIFSSLGAVASEMLVLAMVSNFLQMVSKDASKLPLQRLWGWLSIENDSIFILCQIMLGLILIRVVLSLVSQRIISSTSRDFYTLLGSYGFKRLITHVPLLELTSKSIGSYITVAGDQIARASRISMTAGTAIIPGVMAIVYFIGIFSLSHGFALFVIIYILCVSIVLFKVLRRIRILGFEQDSQSIQVNSLFIDAVNSVVSIRSLNAMTIVSRRYSAILAEYLGVMKEIELEQALSKLLPVLLLVGTLSLSLVLIQVISPSSLSVNQVVSGIGLSLMLMRLFPALGQAVTALMTLASDSSAAQAVLNFIDHPQELDPKDGIRADELVVEHASESVNPLQLELKHVSFFYPKTQNTIFEGLSATFLPGKIYGIKGPSGQGKSTFGQIIAGLIQQTSGEIRLKDPITGSELLPEPGQVLLVTQNAAVLSGSLRLNITFGYTCEDEEIHEALWTADIYDFVVSHDEGLEHVVKYQGSNLSGGQKQRLALARALLRKPKVLVLDEVTSGLDRKTRDTVFERVTKKSSNRIVIFISHDDELLSRCDHILNFTIDGVRFI